MLNLTDIPLTNRQRQILNFISESIENKGFPPTRTEISLAFGFRSPNAAESHLRALQKKGVIRILSGISRGITLTNGSAGRHNVPLVGRVAAGSPILAAENIDAYYPIGPGLFRENPDYLLRVTGDSMKNAGILSGDLLAVKKTPLAENGQIVVARIDDEVTVKEFHRSGPDRVSLLPANPDYKAIEVNLKRRAFSIEGVYVGVLRRCPD